MSQIIYIVSASRTPIGTFNGFGKFISAIDLGVISVKHALKLDIFHKLMKIEEFDDTESIENFFNNPDTSFLKNSEGTEMFFYYGCVLSCGLGQNLARNIAMKAGLPSSVSTATVNNVCGSGLRAINLAYEKLKLSDSKFAIAGGVENMTQAPYFINNFEKYKIGNREFLDSVLIDGLTDSTYGETMLSFADKMSKFLKISRSEQEEFAKLSFEKTKKAIENGAFDEEIAVLDIKMIKNKHMLIEKDEHIDKVNPENFCDLKTVIKDGTITAATSSPISDGAACVVLADEDTVKQYNIEPLGKIVGFSFIGTEPFKFSIAPVLAVKKLCKEIDWDIESVDLFEINEAFAIVPIAVHRELKIPYEKINVTGGGCSMGNPLGSSGARIVVTLVHNMKRLNKKRGIATLCVGGGEGIAIAIER